MLLTQNKYQEKEVRVLKKQSAFRIAFPVSAVWFGAIVGPSMISGVYESVYFAPYGAWGIILPMIAMGIAAVVIGMGANVARRFRVYDYNSYSKKLYGKFSKILTPVLEIYMVIAMIVGGSAVIAMSSTFLNDLLGIPQLGGALIMAVICIVRVLWGAGLVRSASSLMSVVMIAGLVILAVLIISERSKELGTIISTWYAPEKNSFWIGLPGAVALGLSNCCNALTLSAVEQKVSRTRDCAAIGIISFVMNSTAFIVTTLMLLPYCPEVLTNTIPILSIIHQHLLTDVPWLPTVYTVVMLLALVSSGVPQLHAVASRLRAVYPARIKSPIVKNTISGIIYFTACILISFLGLSNIVSTGYSILGYAAIPLLAIPICIVWPAIWHRRKKKGLPPEAGSVEP